MWESKRHRVVYITIFLSHLLCGCECVAGRHDDRGSRVLSVSTVQHGGPGSSDTNITFTPATTYFILCIRLPVNMSRVKSLYRKHASKCYLCVSIIPRRSESPITTTEYDRTLWFIHVLAALVHLQASVVDLLWDRGKLRHLPLRCCRELDPMYFPTRNLSKGSWEVCSSVYDLSPTTSFHSS